VKPRRTPTSNLVFRLDGGNEDNDLWVERAVTDEDPPSPCLISVWEPSDDERQRIADGDNVALVVWGTGHPPVMVTATNSPLGKAPDDP
jgi:hypothetical protein